MWSINFLLKDMKIEGLFGEGRSNGRGGKTRESNGEVEMIRIHCIYDNVKIKPIVFCKEKIK
jgi:hypothetical protein